MKQYIFLIGIFFIALSLKAQTKETIDQNRTNYVGQKPMSFFKQQPHAKWFMESYDAYELDQKTLKKLKNQLDGIKIKVFMSVWCHDSHREIPRLSKILEAINYASDAYWGDPERFKFKASIDTYSTAIEISDNTDRIVRGSFSIKLFGYIVPDNIQKELTAIKKFNSKSKIIIGIESVNTFPE